jgi:hypothetical protein
MTTNKISIALLILGLVVGAGVGFGLYELRSNAASIVLPKDAIKLSETVPAMGEHWANPSDMPVGPIYLVYKGDVIGLEFMVNNSLMENVTSPTENYMEIAGLPVNTRVDHMDIEFMPQGHPGYTVPHYDVHLYFITRQEQQKILP